MIDVMERYLNTTIIFKRALNFFTMLVYFQKAFLCSSMSMIWSFHGPHSISNYSSEMLKENLNKL